MKRTAVIRALEIRLGVVQVRRDQLKASLRRLAAKERWLTKRLSYHREHSNEPLKYRCATTRLLGGHVDHLGISDEAERR